MNPTSQRVGNTAPIAKSTNGQFPTGLSTTLHPAPLQAEISVTLARITVQESTKATHTQWTKRKRDDGFGPNSFI